MNLEKLDLTANVSQLISLFLLLKDASNNDVMRALQDQNTIYFERIIQLLEDIKKLLTTQNNSDNKKEEIRY